MRYTPAALALSLALALSSSVLYSAAPMVLEPRAAALQSEGKSALAAGNTVILKPSEMTPSVSAVMAEVIADAFPSNEVALFEGSLPTSQALLDLNKTAAKGAEQHWRRR